PLAHRDPLEQVEGFDEDAVCFVVEFDRDAGFGGAHCSPSAGSTNFTNVNWATRWPRMPAWTLAYTTSVVTTPPVSRERSSRSTRYRSAGVGSTFTHDRPADGASVNPHSWPPLMARPRKLSSPTAVTRISPWSEPG